MSNLNELLKRAEGERYRKRPRKHRAAGHPQERRRKRRQKHSAAERREPGPPTVERAVDSPAWEVKMVSPTRYVRFKPGETHPDVLSPKGKELWDKVCRGADEEPVPDIPISTKGTRRRRIFTTRCIAAAAFALLLLFAGVVATYVWPRRAAVPTQPNALTSGPHGQADEVVTPEVAHTRNIFQALGWSGPVTFTGEIAHGLKIEMKLLREGPNLSGSYYYVRIGKDIQLLGTVEETGSVVLEEFVKGQKTGVFTGEVVSDERIEGKWSKPGSTGERSFFLVRTGPLQSTTGSRDQGR